MTLLNMSFYGAVIILAVLLIRAFTIHKLPKKTFLILWGVAMLRLLVPFEIASGFSLYSLLPEEFSLSKEADTSVPAQENPYAPFENYADYLQNQNGAQSMQDDTVIVDDTGGAIYLPVETPDGGVISLPNTDAETQTTLNNNTAKQSSSSTPAAITFPSLLPTIWGIGVLLCTAFFLISYLRCHREFSTSLPVTEDYAAEWLKQHPLKRTISIRRSDKISAPLTYGIFRPVILMPKKTDWTNTQQLDYVLYHEFTHIRRFDLAAKLVMIAAVCLHWFNPLVWVMYFFFNRDLELSCDDCVVKHFNESKADYANTLIGMEEKKNYSTPLCNHFSKNAIEERITAIMKSKKTTLGMIIAAVVLVIVVVVTLTTGRKDKTPDVSDNKDSVLMEYKEVLTPRIEEYLTMMNSCFLNNPPISVAAVPENSVSINNNTGLYPVDEEAFPSYEALIGYVKSICTEEHADALCRSYWQLENYTNPNLLPNIGVLDGKAYTKLFHSTTYPESFEITDIKENIQKYDDTTLSATFRFTEGTNPYYWGVLTFAKQDDTWYVADVTLHRHPMDVSPTPTTAPDDYPYDLPPWDDEEYQQEVLTQQLIDLYDSYRSMYSLLFYSGLECGMHTYLPIEEVTINGTGPYYKVLVEQYPTLQSVVDYMEGICTPYWAEHLRNVHLDMDSDQPLLAELDGQLYTQYYSSSTWDEPVNFRFMNLTYYDENTVALDYQGYGNTPIDIAKWGTILYTHTEEGWRIASTSSGYGNPYFDAYDGSSPLQVIKCLTAEFGSSALCNDIIFYFANEGDTLDSALSTMVDALSVPMTLSPEHPYQQIGIVSWRVPLLTSDGKQSADYILLAGNGIYRLQREEAANAMLEGNLTYDTDWVYNEELMALPDTTTPDWYAAVEELMHGRTPADTIELSNDTVIPTTIRDALREQAKSYLAQCGLGTEFASNCHAVCQTGGYTVYSADISYSVDNSPTYFTVYHAYDGEALVGKVILRHLIPFYDAINESRENAMYYNLDDVVRVANREFEAFYAAKGYDRPYKITSIHMTSFESIEVEFLISESDNFEIYTAAVVKFTYNFATETWSVSSFRETPPTTN